MKKLIIDSVLLPVKKTVCGAKAVGTYSLIELLTAEEMEGVVKLPGNSVINQGRIVHVGPALEKEKWGIKEGDRVLLQGTFVPLPKYNDKELVLADPHTIKCVLDEK